MKVGSWPAFPLRREAGGVVVFGSWVSGKFTPAGRASRIAEPAAPGDSLHLGLLGDLQRVLDLDAKVSDCAFQFAMAK
jgi:hypothetical protein